MVPYTTGLQRASGPSLWKNPLRHLWVCTTVVVCLLLLLSYWLCCHVRSTSYLRCSICFWVLIYSSRRCSDKPSWSWLMHSSFIHFLCVLYFCYFTGTVVFSNCWLWSRSLILSVRHDCARYVNDLRCIWNATCLQISRPYWLKFPGIWAVRPAT